MATASAFLDFKNYVLYVCSCSQRVVLEELYFCRHCKLPRCGDCVSTVVDNSCISCPHCFEIVGQANTKSKRNCCAHCFQCPMCSSTLTTRFVQVPIEPPATAPGTSPGPSGGDTTTPKTPSKRLSSLRSPGGTKYYYLSCTHCRWTTRDVSIVDKRSPLDFKDRPHPHQDRFTKLLAYYKELDLQHRMEKEQMKKQMMMKKSRPYSGLLDSSKFKLQSIMSIDKEKFLDIPSKAKDPEPLSDDLYLLPVDVTSLCSLEQTFRDPAYQPVSLKGMWPRPLMLHGKKVHRCKGCDHILLKPDVNLNSTRFKIQHISLQTFPRVRLTAYPKLASGKESVVFLSFTNPNNYPVSLSFEGYRSTERLKEVVCQSILPDVPFTLSTSEDIEGVLDTSIAPTNGDGGKESKEDAFIVAQEPGKLVLKFIVVSEVTDVDAKIAFVLCFSYKALVESEKTDEPIVMKIPVLVNCGHDFQTSA